MLSSINCWVLIAVSITFLFLIQIYLSLNQPNDLINDPSIEQTIKPSNHFLSRCSDHCTLFIPVLSVCVLLFIYTTARLASHKQSNHQPGHLLINQTMPITNTKTRTIKTRTKAAHPYTRSVAKRQAAEDSPNWSYTINQTIDHQTSNSVTSTTSSMSPTSQNGSLDVMELSIDIPTPAHKQFDDTIQSTKHSTNQADRHQHAHSAVSNVLRFESNKLAHFPGLAAHGSRYVLHCTLHASLFGCVKLGYDTVTNKRVCIKVSSLRSMSLGMTAASHVKVIEDVRSEAAILRNLTELADSEAGQRSHFIVRFIGEYVDHDTHYVVTEFASGGDLYSLLSNQSVNQPKQYVPPIVASSSTPIGSLLNAQPSVSSTMVLTPDRVRTIFIQLCLAVSSMHALGIAHRDISIENVCLTDEGDVRLIDLGLAVDVKSDKARRAKGVTRCGKTAYMSPEAYHSGEDMSSIDWVANDIHAIGVVLYTLCTCRPPYYRPEPSDEFYVNIASSAWLIELNERHQGVSPEAALLIDSCIKPQSVRSRWCDIWSSSYVRGALP